MNMAIPWFVALRAVPWGTLIANAPSILRSADALRSRTAARRETVSSNDVQALGERVAGLEQRERHSAELITQLTGQVAALTAAVEVLEARVRWLLVIAAAAVALAVLAGGVSLFARG